VIDAGQSSLVSLIEIAFLTGTYVIMQIIPYACGFIILPMNSARNARLIVVLPDEQELESCTINR